MCASPGCLLSFDCVGPAPSADPSVCLKRKVSAVVDAPALHLALRTCLDKSTNLGFAVHGPMKSARMLSIEGGKVQHLVLHSIDPSTHVCIKVGLMSGLVAQE